jgi:hypothetical protein
MFDLESNKKIEKLLKEEPIKSELLSLLLEAATQNDIVKYIKDRRIINFRYDSPIDPNNEGYYRNIEPFVLGVSKAGNLVLRAWQHNLSSSVTGAKPNWRLFRLDGISEILPVNHKFPTDIKTIKQTRPGYNENDRDMVKIIASVLPLKPSDLTVNKTVDGSKVKTSANQKSFFQKQQSDFSNSQKQKKQQSQQAKEKPSVFANQASKMKIPVIKPKKGVDKGWMKNMYQDWSKKQVAKTKNKNKGFSK